jgi:mannose-6-phosphate isomerase-like protein (cupin superfamily)
MIVSFCNQYCPNLWIDGKFYIENEALTGLAEDNENVYAVSQLMSCSRNKLYKLNKKTETIEYQEIDIDDPHSMVKKDKLYIVSSGEGAIYADGELFWKSKADKYEHINSLFYNKDFYIASLYGGYIKNITTGKIVRKGIKHPHSIFIDNDIYYLESGTGTLWRNKEKLYQTDLGYIRGLKIENGKVYIGVSRWREVSKSGRTRQEVKRFGDLCGILVIVNKKLVDKIEFKHHNEIYDII